MTVRPWLSFFALAAPSLAFATPGYLEFGVSAVDAGENLVLVARGAEPGADVQFVRGTGIGHGRCPASLAPDCLQLTGTTHVVGTVVADADGVAELVVGLGQLPVGRDVAFQAVSVGADVRMSEARLRVTRPNGSTDPYTVGLDYVPTGPTTVYPDLLVADTIELTEAVTVTGFDCLGRTLGAFYRAALYDDLDAHPNRLVAWSPSTPVNVGSNPSINLSPATVLPPGRYWLAVVMGGIVDTYENDASPNSPEYLAIHTFHLPLPDPMVGGAAVAGPRWACSVQVQ